MTHSAFLKNLSSELLNHPEVGGLLSIIEDLSLEIEHLKKEIRMLKGHSAKPTIPASSNLEGKKSEPLKKGKKKLFY